MKGLDLYCCAGGTSWGYDLAGIEMTGIDIQKQPNYPFKFIKADAIEYLTEQGHEYDFIHASPPCQAYSPLNAYNKCEYPDLIKPTREALKQVGKPYVIENVTAARRKLRSPRTLCGKMFGLKMYRHRLFECSFITSPIRDPAHIELCTRNGYLPSPQAPFMTITGGKHSQAWLRRAKREMGVPWMETIREVCEAIPPVYTEWIGTQFLKYGNRESRFS